MLHLLAALRSPLPGLQKNDPLPLRKFLYRMLSNLRAIYFSTSQVRACVRVGPLLTSQSCPCAYSQREDVGMVRGGVVGAKRIDRRRSWHAPVPTAAAAA